MNRVRASYTAPMIVVDNKPIGIPKPNSPGVSYTLWRLRLEDRGVPRDQISGVISRVASYALQPTEVIRLTFVNFETLYNEAANPNGVFAAPFIPQPVIPMEVPVVVAPARVSVQYVVLALIDHPIVVYQDQPVRSEEVVIAIANSDLDVAIKQRASAQWGEREQATDFHDDVVPAMGSKQLIVVDDYHPNSDGQFAKITTALEGVAVTGTLFIIGHCDGESGRLAGLTGDVLAGACNGALAGARSVVLWGCHSAGVANSSQEALMLAGPSVMTAFHGGLAVSIQVQGFTCFVNAGLLGARLRFNSEGGYADANWSAVDCRFASALQGGCKHILPG